MIIAMEQFICKIQNHKMFLYNAYYFDIFITKTYSNQNPDIKIHILTSQCASNKTRLENVRGFGIKFNAKWNFIISSE